MSIYIIQPKSKLIDTKNLISSKLTQSDRCKSIEEVKRLWQHDSAYLNVREWVEDAEKRGQVKPISSLDDPGVTGAFLVETDNETSNQMKEEISSASILKDEPIELISPKKNTVSLKMSLSEDDLWHLNAINLSKIRKEGFSFTGNGVRVAVLDTGIDGSHPELKNKIAGSYQLDVNQFSRKGAAQELYSSQDTEGHGTHVAGLICGDLVGVAPGAEVINGMMLPQGNGSLASFIVGMRWLSSRSDIDIVNISAGEPRAGLEILDLYAETLLSIGILPICAVGNEGRNRTRSPGNCRSVVSVGAADSKKSVAAFSSSGTIVLDHHQYNVPSLLAPGVGVYSSVIGGGYEAWDGTSMAAPIVSGIAALVLEQYPDITVSGLTEELLLRCSKLSEQPLERQGAGIIRVQ